MTDITDLIAAFGSPNPPPLGAVSDLLRESGRWDESAVRRLVCEYREADWPRLVYADWLDEQAGTLACPQCHGHPRTRLKASGVSKRSFIAWKQSFKRCRTCDGSGRVPDGNAARAEFIRVQCEHARLLSSGYPCFHDLTMPKDCAACVLRRREGELLANPRYDWLSPPPGFHGAWGVPFGAGRYHAGFVSDGSPRHTIALNFRRGFPDEVACSAAEWLSHADGLYWSPRQTAACGRCKGVGGFVGFGSDDDYDCDDCTNSGRVPRPWPRGCHPLREVTLTTWPYTPDIRSFNALRRWARPLELEWNIGDTFAAEWPGLIFQPPGLIFQPPGQPRPGYGTLEFDDFAGNDYR